MFVVCTEMEKKSSLENYLSQFVPLYYIKAEYDLQIYSNGYEKPPKRGVHIHGDGKFYKLTMQKYQ